MTKTPQMAVVQCPSDKEFAFVSKRQLLKTQINCSLFSKKANSGGIEEP